MTMPYECTSIVLLGDTQGKANPYNNMQVSGCILRTKQNTTLKKPFNNSKFRDVDRRKPVRPTKKFNNKVFVKGKKNQSNIVTCARKPPSDARDPQQSNLRLACAVALKWSFTLT